MPIPERSESILLVVGEVLVDLISERSSVSETMTVEARFGGSPANVAVGLARLGVPVGFGGRLARGGYGPWLRQHLEKEGVDITWSVEATEACTLALVTIDAAGVGSYTFYGPCTADWAWRSEELPDPASLAGGAVHTGSLATVLMPGAGVLIRWLQSLRARGDVTISYDPNLRPSLSGGTDLLQLVSTAVKFAHVVKVSDDDLMILRPGVPSDEIVGEWLAPVHDGSGPEIVIVTLGDRGAVAWHRDGRRLHCSARPVPLVDTIGAGDAFSAGLLSSLFHSRLLTPRALRDIDDESLWVALECGARVAEGTCSRRGADPPSLGDLPWRCAKS